MCKRTTVLAFILLVLSGAALVALLCKVDILWVVGIGLIISIILFL